MTWTPDAPGTTTWTDEASGATITKSLADQVADALADVNAAIVTAEGVLADITATGKVIRSGAGAPTGADGNDGDFWLRTTPPTLYGPKASGAWPAGVSLVGSQGAQGNGVSSATVNGSGHLIVTLTDASTIDAGSVIGPAGSTGATGATGAAGVGIASATVNGSGHLVLTKTDASTIDAGSVIGPAGPAGSGSGDVLGPASSTTGHLAVFADATGKVIADGGAIPTGFSGDYNDLSNKPTLGTAAAQPTTAFATAAQGAKADTAVQPGSLATVATSGSYNDLSNKPTLGTTATINAKTAAYTVVAGDLGTIINCTSGTFTVSLTAAATLGTGFRCWIWNSSATSTDAITIDPNLTETIDGKTTLVLRMGEGLEIICDGTSWLTGARKSSRIFSENVDATATRASASGNRAVAIGPGSSATGSSASAFGASASATGANAVALASGTAGGQYSFAVYGSAASNYSVAIGNNSGLSTSQAATGASAMALGGSYASGVDSFAAASANNTSTYGATGANSVAIGYQSKASAQWATVIGGNSGVASGAGAIVLAGRDNVASGSVSVASGLNASATLYGKMAHASGNFAATGDAQTGKMVLRVATTTTGTLALTADGGLPGSANIQILPNNSAVAFEGLIVARQQAAGGTASAAWQVSGLIRREGTAASTTLVASTVTAISNAPGWTAGLLADTTNGGLYVTFAGAAATNIRAVCTLRTSEVTYA